MTTAAPGVLRRAPTDARPQRYRRTPEPRASYAEEVAAAEARLAEHRKHIAIHLRRRR